MSNVRMYYEEDANPEMLRGKKIAVIGYGSQGHAHALNLKESGVDVCVGLYKGSKSWERAEKEGLEVLEASEAVKKSDFVIILVPDEKQAKLYKESVEPYLTEGKSLISVSYTHLRAHETPEHLVCRLLLEKKKKNT